MGKAVEHEEWLNKAELFALGVLESEERREFEAHRDSGCALCAARIAQSAAAFDRLAASLTPVTPPPGLKSELLERIASEQPGLTFIHASEGDWLEMAPGIFAKILFRDDVNKNVKALVRMAPGTRYQDHRHTQTEELLVLEGSCYCGGRLLRKGDYHRAEPGSYHSDTRTTEGSLMLLTTAIQNEMMS